LPSFTAGCQHPTTYQHTRTTKRITTLQLFRNSLAEICLCFYLVFTPCT